MSLTTKGGSPVGPLDGKAPTAGAPSGFQPTAAPDSLSGAPASAGGGPATETGNEVRTLVDVEVTVPATLGDVRALIEGELTDVVPGAAVSAVSILVDEMAGRAAAARLLPLRVVARVDDAAVVIEVEWSTHAGYESIVLDQWSPDGDEDFGLMLIKGLADVFGVDLESDRGGKLWCRLSTL
jgi:hypothetical protein